MDFMPKEELGLGGAVLYALARSRQEQGGYCRSACSLHLAVGCAVATDRLYQLQQEIPLFRGAVAVMTHG